MSHNNNRAKSHCRGGGTVSLLLLTWLYVPLVSQFALWRSGGGCIRKEVQELFGQVLVNPSGSCCSAPLTS
jgi:hypothetical protein